MVYLMELKKHFTDVVLLTSQSALSENSMHFLRRENIMLYAESNEGYDFGMWYKAFRRFNLETTTRVALVNDSCILYKPLTEFITWLNKNDADLKGMTFSQAIADHIQSYFLVLGDRAIKLTKEYFDKHGVIKDLAKVIQVYELGLSSHLRGQGLTMAAYMDNNGYKGEFSPYYYCVDYHLKKGIPLIKKKIIFSSYRKDELLTLERMNFNIDPQHYVRLIKENNKELILDFDKLQHGNEPALSPVTKMKYHLMRVAIKLLRPMYKK